VPHHSQAPRRVALALALGVAVVGAWFAWESAASGEDVTPSFVTGPGGRRLEVLTGDREIHVVADIAWAVDTYVRWSGDDRFLDEGGAELVLQSARFFATRAEETPRGFEILHVIGPDELHEDSSAPSPTPWQPGRSAAHRLGRRRPGEAACRLARWRDRRRMAVLQ
jgi:trehalose/maltose hydrolase-like predicted phosphorylase